MLYILNINNSRRGKFCTCGGADAGAGAQTTVLMWQRLALWRLAGIMAAPEWSVGQRNIRAYPSLCRE